MQVLEGLCNSGLTFLIQAIDKYFTLLIVSAHSYAIVASAQSV